MAVRALSSNEFAAGYDVPSGANSLLRLHSMPAVLDFAGLIVLVQGSVAQA